MSLVAPIAGLLCGLDLIYLCPYLSLAKILRSLLFLWSLWFHMPFMYLFNNVSTHAPGNYYVISSQKYVTCDWKHMSHTVEFLCCLWHVSYVLAILTTRTESLSVTVHASQSAWISSNLFKYICHGLCSDDCLNVCFNIGFRGRHVLFLRIPKYLRLDCL